MSKKNSLVVDEIAEKLWRQLIALRLEFPFKWTKSKRQCVIGIRKHLEEKYGPTDFRTLHVAHFLNGKSTFDCSLEHVQYIIHAEARGHLDFSETEGGFPAAHGSHEQWMFFLKKQYEKKLVVSGGEETKK